MRPHASLYLYQRPADIQTARTKSERALSTCSSSASCVKTLRKVSHHIASAPVGHRLLKKVLDSVIVVAPYLLLFLRMGIVLRVSLLVALRHLHFLIVILRFALLFLFFSCPLRSLRPILLVDWYCLYGRAAEDRSGGPRLLSRIRLLLWQVWFGHLECAVELRNGVRLCFCVRNLLIILAYRP